MEITKQDISWKFLKNLREMIVSLLYVPMAKDCSICCSYLTSGHWYFSHLPISMPSSLYLIVLNVL